MYRPTKVRFLRPWMGYPKGAVITPQPNVRKLLLQKKCVEIVREQEQIETAVLEAPENAARLTLPPKRKRGRPRKVPVA